jgi:LPS-assembly lipoprotein
MRILMIIFIFLLSACSFHLRGHNANEKNFPFGSLFVKSPSITPFVANLKNNLELYQIKIAATPAEADLTLDIVSEASSKQILALSGAGQVLEFQLNYRVSLRAYDKQMREWLPADEISLQRSLTYNDAQILAKEQEEAMLFSDMRSDAVQQVMRRLSRAKPRPDPANLPDAVISPVPASPADRTGQPAPAK